MTVCIAGLCRWNYAPRGKPDDWGVIALTASDRMITFGDVQYEPNQTKIAPLSRNAMLLIAGDYSLHSEAIRTTMNSLAGREDVSPKNAALLYGRTIQAIKRRHAEDILLAPIGLNTDMLHAQQKEMSDGVTIALINQLQDYKGEEVEAVVVGMEGHGASIYHIDTRGTVTCVDDVGFAAIGSGAWHARSHLMQTGYTNASLYFDALSGIFSAKKAADISPGVGTKTDIHILYRDKIERLDPDTDNKLHELHNKFVSERADLARKFIDALIGFVIEQGKDATHEQGKEQPGAGEALNESASTDASEAARTNEVAAAEEGAQAAE